ncbi:MAG: DUF192 domain-containing protein [Candidatus Micrarchaeia archaeon]
MCITKLLKKFQTYKYVKIKINDRIINVRVADTIIKKMLGLMYEKKMNNNEGMLFIFENETYAPIWMRNMLFPIDVLWLDKNMNVVEKKENLKPAKLFEFKTYGGKAKAKYIIELPSGLLKNLKEKRIKKIKVL